VAARHQVGDNPAMRSVLLVVLVGAACGEVEPRVPDAGAGMPDAGGPATITFTSQVSTGEVMSTDLVAYQDGDGPWQVVSGTAGVYSFPVTSGRYGLLAGCERASDGSTFVTLGYFAVSDGLERFELDFCRTGTPQTVTISGGVSGTMQGENLWVSDGISASAGLVTSWSMPAIAGPGTLIGMRITAERPTAMLLQRVTFSASATFNLDFANQFFPAESQLTLDPTGTANLLMQTHYIDESGGLHRIDLARTAVTSYRVVPGDRVGTGILLLSQRSSNTGASRRVERAFKSPVAQTLTLPSAYVLARPPAIVATSPYPIVEVALPRRAGASHYALSYFTSAGQRFHSWTLTYSAAWADATPGTELMSRLPDLSALAGWKPTFGLATPGGSWSVSVTTGPTRLLPGVTRHVHAGRASGAYQDGDELTSAGANGSFP
jgi:hypothetical protein